MSGRWRQLARFRIRGVMAVVALVALGFMAPGWWCRANRYWKRKPGLDAMERRITLHSPRGEGIAGVLKRVREASISPRHPRGMPIYVEPAGLQESGWTIDRPLAADFDVKDMPTKDLLDRLLNPLGLAYTLTHPDADALTITSKEAVDVVLDPYGDCARRPWVR